MENFNQLVQNPIIWVIGAIVLFAIVAFCVIISRHRRRQMLKDSGLCHSKELKLNVHTCDKSGLLIYHKIPQQKLNPGESSLSVYLKTNYLKAGFNNIVLIDPADIGTLEQDKPVFETGTASNSIYTSIIGLDPEFTFFTTDSSDPPLEFIKTGNDKYECTYKVQKDGNGYRRHGEESKYLKNENSNKIVYRLMHTRVLSGDFKGLTIMHVLSPKLKELEFKDYKEAKNLLFESYRDIASRLIPLISEGVLSRGPTILIPPLAAGYFAGKFGFNEDFKNKFAFGDKNCWGAIAKMTQEVTEPYGFQFLIFQKEGPIGEKEVAIWCDAFNTRHEVEISLPM